MRRCDSNIKCSRKSANARYYRTSSKYSFGNKYMLALMMPLVETKEFGRIHVWNFYPFGGNVYNISY